MSIGLPGLDIHRRTIRGPVNPLDKSTVVSIFPKRIDELKHTLQPGRFIIEPGTYDKPAILTVGPSSWWRELDEQQPLLEIPVSSIQIAESIVVDYCNGLLASNMSDCMPGLFIVPGAVDSDKVKKDYKGLLDKARDNQNRWYRELVKIADNLWSRTNGNPLAIGDDMRLAAQELRIEDKPWMQDFKTMTLVNCPACGQLRNNSFPVCANCKTILDKKRFDELGLKVAG